jgi:predicted Zn-dependent protease
MKTVESRHGRRVTAVMMFSVGLMASLCVAETNAPKAGTKAVLSPVAPAGETEGDRIGREGLYQAVSAMLITEADMVKDIEVRDSVVPAGQSEEMGRIQQLMYSGLDDVLDDEYERAIPKLEAVIEAEPTYLSVWSTLGWTYWRVGRKDDAIALWQRLLALDNDNPIPHMLLGNAYVGTEQLKKGEMHLKRSIELDPKLVEPRLVLSSVYRWSGRHQASIKLLRELLGEAPDRLDIQNELALSLYFNGDYDEALPLLQQGVRADPDNRQLVTAHARCLLHTGNITEAEIRAKRLLDEDKVDMDLLLLLADAPRYKNTPEQAVPYLEEIAWSTEDPIIKREALRRLIELYVRLWEREPEKYPLDKAREAARELVKMDPEFMPWQQELGELSLMDTSFVIAEDMFKGVIANGNTNCLRAHIGLCETYQATKMFDKAVEEFEIVQSLDTRNPYHYNMLARLEMTRAGMEAAYKATDKLEAAGARGAVAVLLYRGLSNSDWSDSMSVRRFRLHILALKQAGFTFLTPGDLPQYFADLERPPADLNDLTPDRAVVITFDHADSKTLALATEIAEDFDLRFAMHVSVGRIEDGDMGVAGWDALRQYAETDRWVFGSMLYNSANLAAVTEDGILGSPLANRLWIGDDETFETPLEYSKRLRLEYRKSRERLREELGEKYTVNFVAYPHGNYGQGERSNVPDAIDQNLNEAAVNYEVGFVQSRFGYAVHGANSLLYQRYAPELFDTGEDVVDHVMTYHPVFLARTLRSEIASLGGRLYRARHMLELLRRDGYPERPYEAAEAFVFDHLAMRFGIAPQSAKANRGEFDLEISHPYAGGEFRWFRDSLHRRNWRTTGRAGLSLSQAIRLEARGGYGEFRQRYDENVADPNVAPVLERRKVRMREKFVGGKIGIRHEPEEKTKSPISVSAGLERHEYRGDAEFEEWIYMADLAIRPRLPIDIQLQFEHEMIPSARSVSEQVAYDMYGYNGAYLVRDWWELWNNFLYYDINDGNDRFHAGLTSLWEASEEIGLRFGIGYDYIDAKYSMPDYWTPYRLNEWWLIAAFRNNISEFYYDVTLKYGIAREDIRPEETAAYNELVARARALVFDPGRGPHTDWVNVLSASAALRKNLGQHLQAHWEGVYNEAPNYYEYITIAGITLIF